MTKTFATVPRLFPMSTVVCIATGPSLCAEDVEMCRGQHVIAVNDAGRLLCQWADILYACDTRFWQHYKGVPEFKGLKYSLTPTPYKDVQQLRNTGVDGIETDPSGLRTGQNSGYQGMNLAVLLGARRIILLGYDLGKKPHKPTHFFGEHPPALRATSPYHSFIAHFEKARGVLARLNVEVINCTPNSALKCFRSVPLAEALQESSPLEQALNPEPAYVTFRTA
jgi:hypothetical protein